MRKRTQKDKKKPGDEGHITRGRYCKIYQTPPVQVRWCGRVVRMQNQRMLKRIVRATMEGRKKIGRRRKR